MVSLWLLIDLCFFLFLPFVSCRVSFQFYFFPPVALHKHTYTPKYLSIVFSLCHFPPPSYTLLSSIHPAPLQMLIVVQCCFLPSFLPPVAAAVNYLAAVWRETWSCSGGGGGIVGLLLLLLLLLVVVLLLRVYSCGGSAWR